MAAKELHDAQMRMMTAKRAIQSLNDELTKATAAAAAATELVDRKREAAAAAEGGFNAATNMTCDCYGTEEKRRNSGGDTLNYRPSGPIEYESQVGDGAEDCGPSYCPVSNDYKPQKPAGNGGDSP
jgi:hypothetical protein